jgi:hypothetical protein
MTRFRRRLTAGLLVLMFFLQPFLTLPKAWALEEKNTFSRSLTEKTAQVFERVGQSVLQFAKTFEARVNQQKNLRLQIKNQFYDAHLRRVFIEFSGSALFSGKLPEKVKLTDYFITSDGAYAYDLTIEKAVRTPAGITFEFRGDIVLSLDKILYDMAKEATSLGTALVFNKAADLLVEFLTGINSEILAQSISKCFAKFSKEAVAISTAELIDNATRVNNKKFVELIKGSAKNGGILTFLTLTILKTSVSSVAGVAGATLGAMAGSALVPGVGGVVGAYLGNKLFASISKAIIYQVAVDLPITFALRKIVACQKLLEEYPDKEAIRAKADSSNRLILRKVKRELDNDDYKTFDQLLDKMDDYAKADIRFFVPVLKNITELLRFKVMEERDWYAAKKFQQLRLKVQEWGYLPALGI